MISKIIKGLVWLEKEVIPFASIINSGLKKLYASFKAIW